MALSKTALNTALRNLFTTPPGTIADCAQAWAGAVELYFAGVVPASTTVSTAAATLKATLQTALSATSGAASAMETAFAAFATTVGAGMAPAFVATPPAGQVGFSTQLATNQATQTAAAASWANLIDAWAKTATATPSAGGSPVPWS